MSWRIDIKVYTGVLVTETPFSNKLSFVTNASRTSDRPVEEIIPPGTHSLIFKGTRKEMDQIEDWMYDLGSDIKIIGITTIKP